MTTTANHLFEIWPSAAVRRQKRTVADGRVSDDQSIPNSISPTDGFEAGGDLRSFFSVCARFRFFRDFLDGGSGWLLSWRARLWRSLWSYRVASPLGASIDLSHQNLQLGRSVRRWASPDTCGGTKSGVKNPDRPRVSQLRWCSAPDNRHGFVCPFRAGVHGKRDDRLDWRSSNT